MIKIVDHLKKLVGTINYLAKNLTATYPNLVMNILDSKGRLFGKINLLDLGNDSEPAKNDTVLLDI